MQITFCISQVCTRVRTYLLPSEALANDLGVFVNVKMLPGSCIAMPDSCLLHC